MNETALTKLVKYKLQAASTIVELLPPKASQEIKSLGRVLLDSINESIKKDSEQPVKLQKTKDALQQVPIE